MRTKLNGYQSGFTHHAVVVAAFIALFVTFGVCLTGGNHVAAIGMSGNGSPLCLKNNPGKGLCISTRGYTAYQQIALVGEPQTKGPNQNITVKVQTSSCGGGKVIYSTNRPSLDCPFIKNSVDKEFKGDSVVRLKFSSYKNLCVGVNSWEAYPDGCNFNDTIWIAHPVNKGTEYINMVRTNRPANPKDNQNAQYLDYTSNRKGSSVTFVTKELANPSAWGH